MESKEENRGTKRREKEHDYKLRTFWHHGSEDEAVAELNRDNMLFFPVLMSQSVIFRRDFFLLKNQGTNPPKSLPLHFWHPNNGNLILINTSPSFPSISSLPNTLQVKTQFLLLWVISICGIGSSNFCFCLWQMVV